MKRFLPVVFAPALLPVLGGPAPAGDKDASAVLDKAIKALGGADKLGKDRAFTWKAKGVIIFNGNESEFTRQTTAKGLTHYRSVFEGTFGGNTVKGVTVLAGDKGWRKFRDMTQELNKTALANQKRTVYLQLIPITVVPLKDSAFTVETAGSEKVGGKLAVGLKITGADKKPFTLYFDKESGLPVKLVAKVVDFMNQEFTQETTYGGYKDLGGIKKATKIENKRDGETFLREEITEFKTLDKVDPKTFTEPE